MGIPGEFIAVECQEVSPVFVTAVLQMQEHVFG
jgi:hypothetical protein